MRDIGSIPTGTLEAAGEVPFYYFVRMVFPSPTGTLRFTNYPVDIGDDTIDFDIEGTTETWDVTRLAKVGTIVYGQDPSAIQSLSFLNIDDYFTDIGILHNFRDTPLTIWRAHFNKTTGALYDKVELFNGVIDSTSVGDLFELLTLRSRFASLFPKRRITTKLFPRLPKSGLKVAWGSAIRSAAPAPIDPPGRTLPPVEVVPPRGRVEEGPQPGLPPRPGPRTIGPRDGGDWDPYRVV